MQTNNKNSVENFDKYNNNLRIAQDNSDALYESENMENISFFGGPTYLSVPDELSPKEIMIDSIKDSELEES